MKCRQCGGSDTGGKTRCVKCRKIQSEWQQRKRNSKPKWECFATSCHRPKAQNRSRCVECLALERASADRRRGPKPKTPQHYDAINDFDSVL